MADVLVEVNGLKKYYPIHRGLLRRASGQVKAVDNVNLIIHKGETLGLVGESGSGKTTLGRVMLRAYEPTSGELWFDDPQLGRVNVFTLNQRDLKRVRQNMQMIFQDPYSSLNPRRTVFQIVSEPLVANKVVRGAALKERVAELLTAVGLRPEYMPRYPHAFSGGQRQRIGIARALALQPKFIVCDEAVSALDVSVQAQILNLLEDLQQRFDLTYLFIAHDLSVVEHISERVAVMYVGKLVEVAPKQALFERPLHPYTEALLSAVPKPDPRRNRRPILLRGEIADPANPPTGCAFHPRCRYAQERCRVETPALREVQPGRFAACHFAEELKLEGVARSAVTDPELPMPTRSLISSASQ